MRKYLVFWLFFLSTICTNQVFAQPTPRLYPSDTRQGILLPTSTNSAQIDGVEYRTAPGFRVLGESNQIIPLQTLKNHTIVKYRLDLYGQLLTVWLPNSAEQQKSP